MSTKKSQKLESSIMQYNWITPSRCSQHQLPSAQIEQWQQKGFCFVSDLLPTDLIQALIDDANQHFPKPDSEAAADISDFGSGGRFTFPSRTVSFNKMTLHPALLSAIAQLLKTKENELRLSQADLWAKYGRRPGDEAKASIQDNADQRIHVDYPNHTIAHPSPWGRPEAVEMILYLDDVDQVGGPTAVVPRDGADDPRYPWPIVDSPGIGDLRYINDRTNAEKYFSQQRPDLAAWRQSLYAAEQHVRFKPGDILFYRHDVWHRGTPMNTGQRRLVTNITYRKAEAEWISTLHTGWAWSAYRDDKFLEKLIATSNLDQRAVLGFPQPESNYWCPETLAAIEARYGMFGFDIQPYKQAMNLH